MNTVSKEILEELEVYVKTASTSGSDSDKFISDNSELDDKWREIISAEKKKIFTTEGSVNIDSLASFRRRNVYVSDIYPVSDYSKPFSFKFLKDLFSFKNPFKVLKDYIKERIHGECIGNRKLLREIHDLLEAEGAIDLLEKYPALGTPGNPYIFEHKGHTFNYRWARHIYFINLVRKNIKEELTSLGKFISMDIGCSYGIFSYLLKSEFPKSTQILLDFPDQLIFSQYFLRSLFPKARFKNSFDFRVKGKIERSDIEDCDFFFLSINDYDLVEGGAVDMVSNFFSFGEMRREWFEKYINGDVFKNAKVFFTSNRFESAPRHEATYDSDLTVMDYPLEKFNKKFFAVNPVYPYYLRGYILRYDVRPLSSQYFDFIGVRNLKN